MVAAAASRRVRSATGGWARSEGTAGAPTSAADGDGRQGSWPASRRHPAFRMDRPPPLRLKRPVSASRAAVRSASSTRPDGTRRSCGRGRRGRRSAEAWVEAAGRMGGPHQRPERGEVARHAPVRAGLDKDVADRRRLDRTGLDRQTTCVGGQLTEQPVAAPPPTRWTSLDRAPRQPDRLMDGLRERGRQAVEDASHQRRP